MSEQSGGETAEDGDIWIGDTSKIQTAFGFLAGARLSHDDGSWRARRDRVRSPRKARASSPRHHEYSNPRHQCSPRRYGLARTAC